MKVGIVGLPQVGKSTIFNLLTHGAVDTSSRGGRSEAHVGIARVPDPKLEQLREVCQAKKITYATIEYVDLPGLAPGEGKAALDTQPKSIAAYLTGLKNTDVLLHVVRAFEDPTVSHPEGAVDPRRDIGLFELEMIFSDLAIVERRLQRLEKDLKKIKSGDLELEYAVLRRVEAALEQEQPLRELQLSPEEQKQIKGFTFFSAKPLLQVINLGDRDSRKIPSIVEEFGLRGEAAKAKVGVTAVCGKIESEIALLSPEDSRMFMEDLGLADSGLERIIRESYSLLDLLSFYTVGDPEARAWAVPRQTTAVKAAGVIHSDFEKGFIKAEVVSYDDMLRTRTFTAARKEGVLRLEGKEYLVRDEDVILFRFNV